MLLSLLQFNDSLHVYLLSRYQVVTKFLAWIKTALNVWILFFKKTEDFLVSFLCAECDVWFFTVSVSCELYYFVGLPSDL